MQIKYNSAGEIILDCQSTIVDIDSGVVLPVSMQTDFFGEIAAGNITGYSYIHKYGQNPGIQAATPEDVIDLSASQNYLGASVTMEVVSSNAADTLAGVGARKVTVVGQNTAGTEITQQVNMNGVTPVVLGTALDFPYRMWVDEIGASGVNVGNISCQISPGGTAVSQIRIGKGQTLQATYRIPTGKTGYLYRWDAHLLGKASAIAEIELYTRLDGFTTGGTNYSWRVQSQLAVAGGAPNATQVFTTPLKFAEQTDFRVKADVDTNGTVIGASFDLVLVDN